MNSNQIDTVSYIIMKKKKLFENQQKLLCFSDVKIDQTLKYFKKCIRRVKNIVDSAYKCRIATLLSF